MLERIRNLHRSRSYWILVTVLLYVSHLSAQEISDSTSYDVLTEVVDRLKRGPTTPQLGEAVAALAVRHLTRAPDTDEAIKGYLDAVQIFESLQEDERQAQLKVDLALLYSSEGYYNEAISLLNEALSFAQMKEDSIGSAIIQSFMGNVYLAMDSISLGLDLARLVRAQNATASDPVLGKLSESTVQTLIRGGHSLDNAADSFSVVERPSNLTPDYYGLCLLNSGYHQLFHNRLIEAEYYLRGVLDTVNFDGELIRDAYMHLASLNELRGDMPDAYSFLKQYSQINDSLLNQRRQRIINELSIQHNTFEQQAKIRELEKDRNIASINGRLQKILTFSLLFGSMIVLLGAYLTIRNYQQRFNANQIITKQNEEINQGRITELENNLKIETMQSMIHGQEAERERIARDLHDSLGGLLSTVKLHFDAVQIYTPEIESTKEYQKAHSLLDEACKEVRNISNNMQPGALLRLGVVSAVGDLINRVQSDATAHIDFQHYGLNGELEQTTALNIYRIVQELLNNSLKHASANQILVQLVQKDDELMVMVEDDGVGYDSTAVKQGMGTENIASRVNFLKGDLSIHSVIGEGTSTLVNIPLS